MTNFRPYIKDIFFHILQRRLRSFPVSILMYHSVGNNSHFFTVKPENFRWQMNYLKNNDYKILSLADVIERISHEKELSPRSVVLTFDDGYEDNFTNVFPVIREFGFHATIFMSTDFIGTDRPVRGVPMAHLSKEQILEMHASGLVDFQSHGLSHRKLTELTSNDIEREMSQSQKLLEELLSVPRKLFAYPYGLINNNILAIAKNLFNGAVGVRRGYVSVKSNIMDLERQSIDSRVTNTRFRLKI